MLSVDPKLYYQAATDLEKLATDLTAALKSAAVNDHLDLGIMGNEPGATTWVSALAQRITEALGVVEYLVDGLGPLADGVNTAGYTWENAEWLAGGKKGTGPSKPAAVTVNKLQPATTTATAASKGLITTLSGLEDAIGQVVPNGDTAKIGALATAWSNLVTAQSISGAVDELKRIAGTFDSVTGAPELAALQALLKVAQEGADVLTTAVRTVADATDTFGKALAALRTDLGSQCPGWLTGLIDTPKITDTAVELPSTTTTSTTDDQKTTITTAGQNISNLINSSSLVSSVLTNPPKAAGDIDKILAALRKLTGTGDKTSGQPVTPASTPNKTDTTPAPTQTSGVTVDQIMQIYPNANRENVEKWLPDINAAMAAAGIDTPRRQAAFIAEMGEETDSFNTLTEYSDGSQYNGRSDLGNDDPGDGEKYRGRGGLQLTGKYNYTKASDALGVNFVDNPSLVADPQYAFKTAAWYWNSHNLNDAADNADPNDPSSIDGISQGINGGTNGQDVRRQNYIKAAQVLGAS